MAGVGIEVKLEGFGALRRKLAKLSNVDLGKALDAVGATVVDQTVERFEREQDPEGQPWRPLQAQTVVRKLGGSRKAYKKRGGLTARSRRHLGAIKILQDDGMHGGLLGSIHHEVGHGQVIVGSNKEYAAIHQFGGAEAGKPEIPARPYLGLSPENIAEVTEVVGDFIRHQVK